MLSFFGYTINAHFAHTVDFKALMCCLNVNVPNVDSHWIKWLFLSCFVQMSNVSGVSQTNKHHSKLCLTLEIIGKKVKHLFIPVKNAPIFHALFWLVDSEVVTVDTF